MVILGLRSARKILEANQERFAALRLSLAWLEFVQSVAGRGYRLVTATSPDCVSR